jgi:ADP-ribosyl-[dinitrogen reductase] hydrolase
MTMKKNRRLGALFGSGVGDSLGTTNEFTMPATPTTLKQKDILGGGPFHLKRGQTTDDTQMSVCLARWLMEDGRSYDRLITDYYHPWSQVAFDIGTTTSNGIDTQMEMMDRPPSERIKESARFKSRSNGALMRCVPNAIMHGNDDAKMVFDTVMTHPDPYCQIVNVIYGYILYQLVEGQPVDEIMKSALERADTCKLYTLPGVAEARRMVKEDLLSTSDPQLYSKSQHVLHTQGYARVAFRLALTCLVRDMPYKEAVLMVANLGGDSDTNCAIVGGLLGAQQGISAIPQDWLDIVLGCDVPGWDYYHPKFYLEFVNWLEG